jgi:hypothetical protein
LAVILQTIERYVGNAELRQLWEIEKMRQEVVVVDDVDVVASGN